MVHIYPALNSWKKPIIRFRKNDFRRAASTHFTPFIWIEGQKLHLIIKSKLAEFIEICVQDSKLES